MRKQRATEKKKMRKGLNAIRGEIEVGEIGLT